MKTQKRINIAIDGPAGVGKTIMSTMLAKTLGYKFLSSGSFYRVVAYNALQNKLDLNDEESINNAWNIEDIHVTEDDKIIFRGQDVSKLIRQEEVSMAASAIAKFPLIRAKVNKFIQSFGLKYKGIIVDGRNAWNIEDIHVTEDDKIIFRGQDVSKLIRQEEVSMAASAIAKFPLIRAKVNKFIQSFGLKYKGIIVDGRDATYRILPQAEVKFFLWATPEVRANRRVAQDLELGLKADYNEVLEDIKIRDYNDTNRKFDPLKISEGSIVIDTSNMSIQENFDVMYKEVRKRLDDEK